MKYTFSFILIFALSIHGLEKIILTQKNEEYQDSQNNPGYKMEQFLQGELISLGLNLDALIYSLEHDQSQKIKLEYVNVRARFKKIEFLIAYLDRQLYEKVLNESPLLKPEPKVANKEIHEPAGFQVLDEVIYVDSEIDITRALKLSNDLKNSINSFRHQIMGAKLYESMIIHAMKEQMVRSFTLGVSGYDTPSSGLGISDLKSVHQGLLEVVSFYEDRFGKERIEQLRKLLNSVKYDEFDKFDRYDYLIHNCIPIIELLENIRQENFIESKEELSPFPISINSDFKNFFDSDFFNYQYFVNIQNVTQGSVDLGKTLFNDVSLSKNGLTSCATCHNEDFAFTDRMAKSVNGDGVDTVKRNSPSLNYSIFANAYFFDLRAHDLSNQFDHVIHSSKEFDSSYPEVVKALKNQKQYAQTFGKVYKSYPDPISIETVNHALKSYIMSLPKFDSEFDLYVQSKSEQVPSKIKEGFNLFMGKANCATCHFPPTFGGLVPPSFEETESEVLGVLANDNLDRPVLDIDEGRKSSGIVKDDYDFYINSFKTVSLRNVSVTAPYMHNGAFNTMKDVVRFYNLGGGAGMGLDVPNQTLSSDSLNLTEEEQNALISFMESLKDSKY